MQKIGNEGWQHIWVIYTSFSIIYIHIYYMFWFTLFISSTIISNVISTLSTLFCCFCYYCCLGKYNEFEEIWLPENKFTNKKVEAVLLMHFENIFGAFDIARHFFLIFCWKYILISWTSTFLRFLIIYKLNFFKRIKLISFMCRSTMRFIIIIINEIFITRKWNWRKKHNK